MNYQEFYSIPPYERATFDDNGVATNRDGVAKWSSKDQPPEIGDQITVTMNRLGPATVTGYFVEAGWLGLRCKLTDPPEWHVKQNNGDPNGHVFGAEITRDPT